MRHALMRLVLVVLVPLLVVEAGILATWYYTRWTGQEEANLEAARGIAAAFDDYVQDVRRQELAIGEALAGLNPYTPAQATAFLTANVREFRFRPHLELARPGGQSHRLEQPAGRQPEPRRPGLLSAVAGRATLGDQRPLDGAGPAESPSLSSPAASTTRKGSSSAS